ncbi:MAG: penicillin-binding protein 2 [Planctomycetaceae bacterium]|nr:penicillin-binding protein 2 [Planctomycetota bacterium]NUN53480.1 penicillin-binding protein 2 [Planctomycetaceae bacterium]
MKEPVVARFRASLIFSFLFLLLAALAGRLFWIQVVQHDHYASLSRGQHLVREVSRAPRGSILDRAGRPLAARRRLPSVAVDPKFLADPEAAAAALSAALGVDREALLARIRKGSRFAWVRRAVDDPAAVEAVKGMDLALREERSGRMAKAGEPVLILEEDVRFHPLGPLASQVLGSVNIDGVGMEGLERTLDARLRGTDGRSAVLVDAHRQPILVPGMEGTPAVPGEDLRLTLDAVIQGFAEDELRRTFEKHSPRGAVCVVLDAETGDVLALASAPTFDPGAPGAATPEGRRARFATDMFEPGSTFKPLVAAAAMDCGAIGPEERIDCGEGWIRIGRRTIHEHEPRGYGTIPVEKVLAVSSNCGMARIGVKMGIPRMQAALGAFGFGRPTSLGFPGESAGRITAPKAWTESYTLVSVSFGQEICVTPLQLAAAYLPVARDGTKPPLRLVDDPSLPRGEPVRVLRPETARRVRAMLETVVTEGTARAVKKTGYRVAGKTGTAQKMKAGETSGYVSSFVGMAPAGDPRLVCLVLLDEPSKKGGTPYGSTVAAPYCTEVLRKSLRYLGVRPDEETDGRRP